MARYQPASSARRARSSAARRKYVTASGSPSQCSMRATGSSPSQLALPSGRLSNRFHASVSSLRSFFSFTPSNPTPLLGPTSTDTPESVAGEHTSMTHEGLLGQLGAPARITRRPAFRLEVRFLL